MFLSTFKGKFNFQGLFKTVLYIQVLFKPVRTLMVSVDGRVYLLAASVVAQDFPASQAVQLPGPAEAL